GTGLAGTDLAGGLCEGDPDRASPLDIGWGGVKTGLAGCGGGSTASTLPTAASSAGGPGGRLDRLHHDHVVLLGRRAGRVARKFLIRRIAQQGQFVRHLASSLRRRGR